LAQDFGRMRSAGLDCVRLILTFEDFQPRAGQVNAQMLALLVKTLDLASQEGLGVMPTLFTGHMSGADWFPAWALEESAQTSRFPVVSAGRVVRTLPINWYSDESLCR